MTERSRFEHCIAKSGAAKHTKEIYQGSGGQWHLTIGEKSCPRCGRRMFKLYLPAPLTVLCLSSVPQSHLPLRAKARRALGPTRECTRLVHMALHPSWRGPMAPARLSCCICEIGRHGQVLGLQDEAFRQRLRRSDLLRHATCIADCCTRVIRYRSHHP